MLLAPGWAARVDRPEGCRARRRRRWPSPLAAQLVCAPVVVLLSGQVSLVAVPANLLAAPAVAPATLLGVLRPGGRAAELRRRPRWSPTWPAAGAVDRDGRARRSAAAARGSAGLARQRSRRSAARRDDGRRGAAGAGPRPTAAGAAAASAAVLGVVLVVPATTPGWPPRRLAAGGVRRRAGRRAGAGCRARAPASSSTPGPTRGPSTGACAGWGSAGCRSCCSPTCTPTTSRACPGCCAVVGSARSRSAATTEPAGELARVRRLDRSGPACR